MFLCHYTCNCNTVSAILTGATFNKKENEPCETQTTAVKDVFSVEAGSTNRCGMIVCVCLCVIERAKVEAE